MPNKSPIEWCDYTSNPLRYRDAAGKPVWACIHASEGCTFCYAERLAHRLSRGTDFTAPNMRHIQPYMDEAELHTLLSSKELSGKRVFIADMTDLFGEWVDSRLIARLWAVFANRPDVTFQVLTKRPERMRELLTKWATDEESAFWEESINSEGGAYSPPIEGWPLPNVWCGVSAETDAWLEKRAPILRRTPAAVRFLSAEPLLGPLDSLDQHLWNERPVLWDGKTGGYAGRGETLPGLDWVIVGGESGGPLERALVERCDHGRWRELPEHCHLCSGTGWAPKLDAVDWVDGIRRQCYDADVPFFFKQWGGPRPKGAGALLHDREWREFPPAREVVHAG